MRCWFPAVFVVAAATVSPVLLTTAAPAAPPRIAHAVFDAEVCDFEPRTENSLHIVGCMTDENGLPVSGITVAVWDDSVSLVGESTSDDTGVYNIALPGDPMGNLGRDWIIEVDTSTFPDGITLRSPEKDELRLNFQIVTWQHVQFPLTGTLAERVEDPEDAPEVGARGGENNSDEAGVGAVTWVAVGLAAAAVLLAGAALVRTRSGSRKPTAPDGPDDDPVAGR